MLEIAAGLSIAGPLFIVGVDFLRMGQIVAGLAFLCFGAFATFFPRFLLRRFLGRRFTIFGRGGDDGADDDAGVLDRLRGR